MTKHTILVVEDDPDTVEMIRDVLEEEGHSVRTSDSVFRAQGLLQRSRPDLVLLDRKLTDRDGIELLKWMRQTEAFANLPVLFLTSKKTVADRVLGLRMGGDDYLPKPFDASELAARVEALLRRGSGQTSAVLSAGKVQLDMEGRRATLAGKALSLRPKEFDLLAVLLRGNGRVISRAALLESVWGYAESANLNTNVLESTVSHLRSKLGSWGACIVAVRGHGYRLDEE